MAAVLALACAALAAEPTTEELARQYVRQHNELVKVLDSATDRASAEKAKPRVDELRAALAKTREQLAKRPYEEYQAAYEAAVKAEGTLADLSAAYTRLAGRFPIDGEPISLVEDAREEVAGMQIRGLLTACEAYIANPNANGKPPEVPGYLVSPPWGGASFLKNGAKDLIDPWGRPYRYAAEPDERGELRAYIWTERTVNGKPKVIGTKPPERKKSGCEPNARSPARLAGPIPGEAASRMPTSLCH